MRLTFDPQVGILSLDGHVIVTDKFYQVDDDHRLVFRGQADNPVIQLMRGRKTVEVFSIPTLSAVAGRDTRGAATPQVYKMDVVPGRPIFPQRETVKWLLGLGIEWWDIHIMNAGETLREAVSKHPGLVMHSGDPSAQERCYVPGGQGFEDLSDYVSFTVGPTAEWAILSRDAKPLGSIYLWPGVAEVADAFKAKVAELRAR